MKKNLSLLATLALAAALSPAAFAQQDQSAPPSQDQPQTQTAPATDTSANAQTPTSFSGTVVKVAKHYALKTDSGTHLPDRSGSCDFFPLNHKPGRCVVTQSTNAPRGASLCSLEVLPTLPFAFSTGSPERLCPGQHSGSLASICEGSDR